MIYSSTDSPEKRNTDFTSDDYIISNSCVSQSQENLIEMEEPDKVDDPITDLQSISLA